MNAISSGVTSSAAKIRSPSFSRSASSITTTAATCGDLRHSGGDGVEPVGGAVPVRAQDCFGQIGDRARFAVSDRERPADRRGARRLG